MRVNVTSADTWLSKSPKIQPNSMGQNKWPSAENSPSPAPLLIFDLGDLKLHDLAKLLDFQTDYVEIEL